MNTVTTTQMGLVPASMAEAMQLANLMATAKLVPQALQKSPADCLMVIQQAIRWNMDVFAVAQECSVIQGKLMHSGKLVAAVINSRGNLNERLSFSYGGKEGDDDRMITVTGRLAGEAEPRTVTVKLKDARTEAKVWKTQADQQLMYHGTRVWARRHTPELMLGVYSPEEFDDVRPNGRPPIGPNVIAAPALPPHDPETGEITDAPNMPVLLEVNDGNWIDFGQRYIAAIKTAENLDEAEAWDMTNRQVLDIMRQEAPKVYSRMTNAVAQHRAMIAKPEDIAGR